MDGLFTVLRPRWRYGDYISAHLSEVADAGVVTTVADTITQIEQQGSGYTLSTQSGDRITADLVFLCLGNPPPSPFPNVQPSHRSITNVWVARALDDIGIDDRVLVIGTGATAVDVVIDLMRRGLRQPITMISRRGLLPLVDAPAETDPDPLETWPELTTRGIFAALLKDTRRKLAAGISWQTSIDTFRLQIAGLWADASPAERLRFSRHLRSIWLVHRHRLAPDVAQHLDQLRREQRLDVVAGRLLSAIATPAGYDVTIRKRGGAITTLAPNWILNCTGPEERYDRIGNPLVAAMLDTGFARRGHGGIGLDVDDSCRLLDCNGSAHPGAYVVGHATRGAFWEVTAVSNIRQQVLGIVEALQMSKTTKAIRQETV
ncbi:FAD/NAD(P)-binding protein [Tardiphaga alba]|uniref:FAD/NAD(P)-binding protein n=1 Tax=Tardiphaga alba TaxID=340268 RepID=UPI001BAB08A4|nr:FAD/NAD(P)-binding protein [Tardiphaga alba]